MRKIISAVIVYSTLGLTSLLVLFGVFGLFSSFIFLGNGAVVQIPFILIIGLYLILFNMTLWRVYTRNKDEVYLVIALVVIGWALTFVVALLAGSVQLLTERINNR